MASFTNFATLSYNGGTTNSNTVTGELLETLTAAKTAVTPAYTAGENVTYAVSLVNTGTAPLTGVTVTDDLGRYAVGANTVYPLAYVDGSVKYYVNGVLQAAPTVTAGPPLTVTGLSIPAGGNAVLLYETRVTNVAPLASGDSITNTATVTGGGLTAPITAQATVETANAADLGITKSLSPTTVTENGQITYTFVISNSGNTEAAAADNVVVTDTFNPILRDIAVTYNGTAWTEGTNYTYNAATGAFATTAGQITVPAASLTRDTATGAVVVTPGISTLTVTGTV